MYRVSAALQDNVYLYLYGQTSMSSFCYKTTGTRDLESGVISIPLNSLYLSHNLCISGSHSSHSFYQQWRCCAAARAGDALFCKWYRIGCTSTFGSRVTECRHNYLAKRGSTVAVSSSMSMYHICKRTANARGLAVC